MASCVLDVLLFFISLVALSYCVQGNWAQVLCDLDQIQVTQTLVVNSSSSSSSYLYRQDNKVGIKDDYGEMGGTSKSGIQEGGSIYHVKVANNCPCSPAAAVTFFCDGFIPGLVRTEVLRVEGSRCLLIEGEALIELEPVRFDYASPRQLPLLLESADFTC